MRPILLDTNVLVMLVVGLFDPGLVGRHRRTRDYSPEDFGLLIRTMERFSELLLVPHVLAETSNLLGAVEAPLRQNLFATLQDLVRRTEERAVPASEAMKQPEYLRLGLTDAVLLRLAETQGTLLTADLDLYLAAAHRGYPAVNFNHLRG